MAVIVLLKKLIPVLPWMPGITHIVSRVCPFSKDHNDLFLPVVNLPLETVYSHQSSLKSHFHHIDPLLFYRLFQNNTVFGMHFYKSHF
jgi:hypothetical protein